MGTTTIRVDWDKNGISQLMQTDEAIKAALIEHGERLAEQNSAAILAKMHSPVFVQPYVADYRVLRNTQAVVVHSTTKAVAAAGRAYGFPRK